MSEIARNTLQRVFSWALQPTLTEAPIQEMVLDAEANKGLFREYGTSNVKLYKPDNIIDYYNAYLNDDLVRAMVDDLTESSLGNGHYNVVEKLSPIRKDNKYKKLADAFGQHFHLDDFLPNITRNTLIAGFCPVETVLQKGKDKTDMSNCKLKIIRPDTIDRTPGKGIKVNTDTFPPEILSVDQRIGDKTNTIRKGTNTSIAWWAYGQLGNDIRGVSYVRGILNLLNTLNEATSDVQKILKRYIAPIGVWKSKQPKEALKQAVINRTAGEDIFLGGLNIEEMKAGVVEFLSIDPRVPFWDYLEYLDRRIWNYSRATNMYYMRNATQASAEILDGIIMRHVTSIQRCIKRGVENYWYEPLLKIHYTSAYEVPALEFGVEKTGVEDIQLEPFLTKGIDVGFVTQDMYYAVLKQLGVDIPAAKAEAEQNEEPEEEPEAPADELPENTSEKMIREDRMFFLKSCMDCGNPVTQSVVWEKKTEDQVYFAWFCDDCVSEWVKKREKVGDKILSVRPVKDGKVPEDIACYYAGYEKRRERMKPS